MNTILFTVLEQIKNISILLNPIIPESTFKVLDTMNLTINDISVENLTKENILNHDKELKDINILFRKIEDDS